MQVPNNSKMNCRGQAIVEMAFVIIILLLLVLGIFEFGRAMYIKNTLTHAARAGARAAIVTADISNATGGLCSSAGSVGNGRVYQAVCTSLYSGIDKNLVKIDITINELVDPPVLSPGDMVTVTVTLTKFSLILPDFIPGFRKSPSGNIEISGDTAMRYE